MTLIFADLVLVIHLCVVIFNTAGLFLIPIGYAAKWRWVSNVKLRVSHCGSLVFVTLETLLGITCPLTSLENMLRGVTQSESFIGFWTRRLIYWDSPAHIFIIFYCVFLGLTFVMWKTYPPGPLARECGRKQYKEC